MHINYTRKNHRGSTYFDHMNGVHFKLIFVKSNLLSLKIGNLGSVHSEDPNFKQNNYQCFDFQGSIKRSNVKYGEVI